MKRLKQASAGTSQLSDETYKTIYNNIAEFYKTLMQDKSTQVSALSFQYLMGLWRQSVWGSKEGNAANANQILKDALNFTGGIQGLITSWEAAIDGGSLTGEALGWAESALAQVIWQYPWLNASKQAGDADITDAQLGEMAVRITDYLNKVNEGTDAKYKINTGIKNHFINCVGSALIILIQTDKYNSSTYAEMGEAYISLADDLLGLTAEQGGGVAYQTSVINVTSAILATAKAKLATDTNNKRLGQLKVSSEDVLLNNDTFDMDAYITEANKQMADSKITNADYKAWVSIGMNNIQKINLEHKTEAVAEIAATQARIETSIQAIKDWITKPHSLKDMREMSWQAGIYSSLTDLLKEVCKDGSKIELTMDIKEDIAAIFGTLKGLKDSKVKEMGTANATALVTFLRAQTGDQKERYQYLANMIEDVLED
jgi:hypothetical protein